MPRIRELDGLRAVAALSVFAHHAISFPALARFTSTGWIGVDLFFVISGYLITTILLGMRGAPHYFKNFYMRRTLRIFPPYYLFLLICFVAVLFSRSYHPSGRLWSSFLFYATSLIVILPWYSGALASVPNPASAIEVTWSLSIEELFYLLWAPGVRFLRKGALILVVAAVILLAPVLRWYLHSLQCREYFFFPSRMDSLAFGAALALIWDSGRRWRISGWYVIAGLAATASALLLIDNPRGSLWFSVFGYTLIAVTMALVVAFVLGRAGSGSLACRALRSKVLVRVGTVSYMFYLLHLFVIRMSTDWFANLSGFHWADRGFTLMASLAMTMLLAELSWRYFESPILKLKSRFSSGRTREAVTTGVLAEAASAAVDA